MTLGFLYLDWEDGGTTSYFREFRNRNKLRGCEIKFSILVILNQQ